MVAEAGGSGVLGVMPIRRWRRPARFPRRRAPLPGDGEHLPAEEIGEAVNEGIAVVDHVVQLADTMKLIVPNSPVHACIAETIAWWRANPTGG